MRERAPMSTTAGSGVEVLAIDTPALGDRSYLAHDGEVAVIVDPQRDIDRVLALAAARGVRITHVFETHLHNDYVTGGLALTRATGRPTTSMRPRRWPSTGCRPVTGMSSRSAR
jgi:glyoxylase-like metal-dependent hydrolase (beta-lactamase superfamily II)